MLPRFSRIAGSVSLAALGLAATASAGLGSGLPYYRVTDLGVRQAVGLNDAGQVALNQVNSSWWDDLKPFTINPDVGMNTQAVLYSSYGPHAGMVLPLDPAISASDPRNVAAGTTGDPGPSTLAMGLTSSGETLVKKAAGERQNYYSADLGSARLLTDGSTGFTPFAMDNSGRLIAHSNPTGLEVQGVVIEGGKATDLNMSDGTPIAPIAITGDGRILGYIETKDGRGNLISPCVVIDHGRVTGFHSPDALGPNGINFMAINSAGDATGWAYTPDQLAQHVYVIIGGVVHDLGAIAGVDAMPTGINDAGQVVGNTLGYNQIKGQNFRYPFLYDSGKVYNLNDLVSPSLHLKLMDVVSINNKGQILVEGYAGSNYLESSYLLTPTTMFAPADVTTAPEPGTLAIMGFAAVAIGLRRRFAGRA